MLRIENKTNKRICKLFALILIFHSLLSSIAFADLSKAILTVSRYGNTYTGKMLAGETGLYPGGQPMEGLLTIVNERGQTLRIDKLGLNLKLTRGSTNTVLSSKDVSDFKKHMKITVRYKNPLANLFEGVIYDGDFEGFINGVDCSLAVGRNKSIDLLYSIYMHEDAQDNLESIKADMSFWIRLSEQYDEEEGGGGIIINPGSGGGSGLIEAPNTPVPAVGIPNITHNCIETMIAKKILRGYEDGRLMLEQPITRAEAAVLLARSLGLEDYDTDYLTYKDKKAIPRWSLQYVVPLTKQDIYRGTDKKRFEPNALINRQEMAAILTRAFKLDEGEADQLLFDDKQEVSDWSKKYVKAISRKGLMPEYENNKFVPKGKVTRGEMVVMLCKLLGYHF